MSEDKTDIEVFMELKGDIFKLMDAFTYKYASLNDTLYRRAPYILVDVLTSCLSDAQDQVNRYHPFTAKQIDHICFQIGEWYMMMKPLLEGQHNLGYMKEHLKNMVCEDE